MLTNTITIAGNPASTPEPREGQDQAVTRFRLICNRRTRDERGEWTDAEPTGVTVKAFGKQASHLATATTKDRLVVTGELRTDTWTDRDGHNRSEVVLYADEVALSMKYQPVR